MSSRWIIDVQTPSGWRLIGSIDDQPRIFVEHIDTELEAHALADSLRAGAVAYDAHAWQDALAALMPAASAGCGVAAGMLGTIFDFLGPHDTSAARSWYEIAANQGDAVAAWNLGNMLETLGDGDEATAWRRRAITLGFDLVDPATAK